MGEFWKLLPSMLALVLLLVAVLPSSRPCAAAAAATTPVSNQPSIARRSLQQEEQTPFLQGGQTAKVGRFPYVSLFLDRSDSQTCGGALVHENWVLTAAHCLDRSIASQLSAEALGLDPLLVVGALDVTDREGTRNVQEYFGSAILHPCWNGNIRDGYDVAMVKLDRASELRSIRMASQGNDLTDGQKLVALGWGSQGPGAERSTRLKWGELLYRSNEFCNADFFWNGIIQPTMMCAAPLRNADVCQGDSGGPLVSPHFPEGEVERGNPRKDLLVGLVSFGNSTQCELPEVSDLRTPAVFTRISEFRPWIDRVISGENPDCNSVKKGGMDKEKGGDTVVMETSGKDEEKNDDDVDVMLDKEDEEGGQTAQEGRFPYMTALLDQYGSFSCSGVLVHESWVATAASCLFTGVGELDQRGIPTAVVGALNIPDGDGTNLNKWAVVSTIEHPEWNGMEAGGRDIAFDIALLKLSGPSKLQPVALADPRTIFSNGEDLVVAGWNIQIPGEEGGLLSSGRLKWGIMPYVSNENCNEDPYFRGLVKPNVMCAASVRGTNACRGDGGGPLILPHIPGGKVENGEPALDVLVGLVSFGEECSSTDLTKLTVFTRISEFKSWIDKVIADDAGG